ncbi:hypothetical protein HMPREF0239_03691 [Clostridium sp. ATCC BAA-442]|nr:hypothetical protein HMPREF0239_03691 [Clostridium sp. ATCC BAA-442]
MQNTHNKRYYYIKGPPQKQARLPWFLPCDRIFRVLYHALHSFFPCTAILLENK